MGWNESTQEDLTLEDFTEIYFNNKKNELKERTILMKKDVIKAHILPYLGRKQMNDIKASDVINWKIALWKKVTQMPIFD